MLGWVYPLTEREQKSCLETLNAAGIALWVTRSKRTVTTGLRDQVYAGYHASYQCRSGVRAYWHLRNGFDIRPLCKLTQDDVCAALEDVPEELRWRYRVMTSHPVLRRPWIGRNQRVEAKVMGGLQWVIDAVDGFGKSQRLRQSEPDVRFGSCFSDSVAILRQSPPDTASDNEVDWHMDKDNGSLEGPCPAFVVSLFEGAPEYHEHCGLYVCRADGSRLWINMPCILALRADTTPHGSVPSKTMTRWSVGFYQNRNTQASAYLSNCAQCPLQRKMSKTESDKLKLKLEGGLGHKS